jgi:phenylalanyl-tRNA synthetase beta chain
MKFSEAWLREWVNPSVSRQELLDQLTMAGLEVDGIQAVSGDFRGVVVAEVLSANKHPDADKLSVCEVSDGTDVHQVVCGAPNVRPGLITAYARVGAVLPGDFKIKRAKLRGVESNGMLCSADELGIGDDHDGIVELDADGEHRHLIGNDLRSVLELDDVTVDLDLTPNRGDCLSMRGLAREVGVLNNLAVSSRDFEPVAATIADEFPVELANPAGCPRYLGRVIKGIDVAAQSPGWMVEKLRRCGLRSIDPVVDVTNYVMLELGQPMHAFDLQVLNDKIVVRAGSSGETLTLLDGRSVELDADTLLIADGSGPVAMAGVMGGERSGIQAGTADVFLECAFFAPLAIAGTARRFGLHTDASHRFERGVDFQLQHRAMERATRLLLDIVGGEPGPITEAVAEAELPQVAQVQLRQARLNELLGVNIDVQDVDQALARLDFQVVSREADEGGVSWTIRAPSHRFDIACEADLVEEVCRIYGYNHIPSRQPQVALELGKVPLHSAPVAALKGHMAALGYHEAITYSFVDPKLQDLLDPGVQPLALANPMSSEQSVMRTSLLPGLLEALRFNVARQQDSIRLFEVGLCFKPGAELSQTLTLGGLLSGRRQPESWGHGAQEVDFFDLKGDVERLFAWNGLGVTYDRLTDPALHPGQAAGVYLDGVPLGRLGRLHPEIERALDITQPVFLFEFAAEQVMRRGRRTHRALSKYPSVRRDIALVVADHVSSGQVESILRDAMGEALVDLRLFDLYQGKGIDSNEKSLGIGLTFQDPSATLTEEDIGNYMGKVLAALADGVGGRLR